jgi:hypothetical protein
MINVIYKQGLASEIKEIKNITQLCLTNEYGDPMAAAVIHGGAIFFYTANDNEDFGKTLRDLGIELKRPISVVPL